MTPRGRLAYAVAAAVCLAACGSGQDAAQPAPLTIASDPTSICWSPVDASDWGPRLTTATEFGIDYLQLRAGVSITVDAVDLSSADGLRLITAAFVRDGGVGGGFLYGNPGAAQSVASWAGRISLPGAVLSSPSNAAAVNGESSGSTWQLVVGVLPATPAGGTADGVKLTYHDSSGTHTLNGKDHLGLTKLKTGCSAPTP